MRYEYYSNLALVSSAVVYMLAMFAHAAEWAAARRLSVTEPAERELVNVAAADNVRPELVVRLSPSTSSARCRRARSVRLGRWATRPGSR